MCRENNEHSASYELQDGSCSIIGNYFGHARCGNFLQSRKAATNHPSDSYVMKSDATIDNENVVQSREYSVFTLLFEAAGGGAARLNKR